MGAQYLGPHVVVRRLHLRPGFLARRPHGFAPPQVVALRDRHAPVSELIGPPGRRARLPPSPAGRRTRMP